MEDRKVTEKRTEVTHEETVEKKKPGTTNVNVGSDGSTQVQEQEEEVVDEPVATTTVHEETRVEEKKSR